MFKIIFLFTFLIVNSVATAALPVNNPNIDESAHTDVRLYKTRCDARWDFDKYMKCLDESRLIPGVRASYFTLRGRARFYAQSKLEGAESCKAVIDENRALFSACVNRFVAHKAQNLGSGKTTNFSGMNFLNSEGSIE